MSKGDDTKALILDRALALASVSGLGGLTIGTLAEALGMSKSGLFAHFGSKADLQLAVLRHGVERFVTNVIAPALKKPRGEARVRTLVEGWIAWDRGLPGGCPLQVAQHEFDDIDGPLREAIVEAERDFADTLGQIARSAVESRIFRSDLDPKTFAFDLTNLLTGYRRHARLFRDPDAESLAMTSFEALLERCRAPA